MDSEKNTVNNAVKLCRHCVGQFIETARQQDYWKEYCYSDRRPTMIARVWVNELVPIKIFHIRA